MNADTIFIELKVKTSVRKLYRLPAVNGEGGGGGRASESRWDRRSKGIFRYTNAPNDGVRAGVDNGGYRSFCSNCEGSVDKTCQVLLAGSVTFKKKHNLRIHQTFVQIQKYCNFTIFFFFFKI